MKITQIFFKFRWPNTQAEDIARAKAIRHLPDMGIDAVELLVPSHREYKISLRQDRLLHSVIETAKTLGLEVIWTRFLWQAWSNPPTTSHIADATWYARAMTQVEMEKHYLGADYACLDCEPYGDAPERQNKILPLSELNNARAAILDAVADTPKLDLVYPIDHYNSGHINWLFGELANAGINRVTYTKKTPTFTNPPVPPLGFPAWQQQIWGSFVQANTGTHVDALKRIQFDALGLTDDYYLWFQHSPSTLYEDGFKDFKL